MCEAPRIDIEAPVEERARYLNAAYTDVIANTDRLTTLLQPLRQHRSHSTVDHWEALLKDGDFIGLARSLIVDHYDPSYAKSRSVHKPTVIASLQSDTLNDEGQTSLTARVAEIVKSL